jgi:Protein of unknown function (DUF1648)
MSMYSGDPAASHKRPVLDLPLSRLEIVPRVLVVVGIAVCIVQLVLVWDALPASVPIHFGVTGRPDRYGSKSVLLILPAVAVALTLLLTLVARFPQSFNYPVRVTPENAPRLYRQGRLLLAWLNVLVVWLFAAIEQQTVEIALGHAHAFSNGFVVLLVAVAVGVPFSIGVLAVVWARHG